MNAPVDDPRTTLIDTSAFVAALLPRHEHHGVARPHLPAEGPIPAIVLAETYSQLRRTFGLSTDVAFEAIARWATHASRIADLPAAACAEVFSRARELDLGGNIHDAMVAKTCAHHGLPLATLDRRQHAVALTLGVASHYLLA